MIARAAQFTFFRPPSAWRRARDRLATNAPANARNSIEERRIGPDARAVRDAFILAN
jgi:hypothetical protein